MFDHGNTENRFDVGQIHVGADHVALPDKLDVGGWDEEIVGVFGLEFHESMVSGRGTVWPILISSI